MGHAINADMRADHRLWTAEHDTWREDVAAWRADVRQVMSSLEDVRCMLQEHESALNTRTQTIDSHEQSEREHEMALETGDLLTVPSSSQDPLAGKHHEETKAHLVQRDAHERMKRHHNTFIAQWRAFLGALREAM